MKAINTFSLAVALTIMGTSCSQNQENSKIVRLDDIVASMPTAAQAEVDSIFDRYGDALTIYASMFGRDGENLQADLDTIAAMPEFYMFYQANMGLNEKLPTIEHIIGKTNARLRDKIGLAPVSAFYGIASPFRQRIVMSDSLMFIALNHFLGVDHEAYSGMPEYYRKLNDINRLPAEVAEACITLQKPYEIVYNDTIRSGNMLSEMLYQGAVLNGVEEAINSDIFPEILGWAPEQLKFVEDNERLIWQTIISREMLYDTDASRYRALFRPAEASYPISPDVPGMAARFIGYKIVKAYRKVNPSAELSWLLSPEFYGDAKSLQRAEYNP